LGLHASHDLLGREPRLTLGILKVGKHAPLASAIDVERDRVADLAVILDRVDGDVYRVEADDLKGFAALLVALGPDGFFDVRIRVLGVICRNFVMHCSWWDVNHSGNLHKSLILKSGPAGI